MGFLVEALRDRVLRLGIDISHYAIQSVRSDIKPYCQEMSMLDYSLRPPLRRRYLYRGSRAHPSRQTASSVRQNCDPD